MNKNLTNQEIDEICACINVVICDDLQEDENELKDLIEKLKGMKRNEKQ